jgi:hypothetical protein
MELSMTLVPLIASLALVQSTPQVGPATLELRALKAADQAARNFTEAPSPEQWKAIEIGDFAREERVRELLRSDLVLTAEDLDSAALIMQHGQEPEDYLLARELSILSCFKGMYHSLPALAEDRFLTSIGKPQRFGSQFSWGAETPLKDMEPEGDYSIADWHRLDILIAPLDLVKEHKMKAFEAALPLIAERMEQSRNAGFQAAQNKTAEAKELAILAKKSRGRFETRVAKRAMQHYRADKLRTKETVFHAASLLERSPNAKAVLLANELAALAAMRGYAPAKHLFATTWDRYAASIGRPDRYGTLTGQSRVPPVVVREFGLKAGR